MIQNILHLVEYLVFLAVSILLLVFFHNYFTFFLLVFLIVFPFLSVTLMFFVVKRLECSLKVPKKSTLIHTESDITVEVKNPTWIPLLGCTLVLSVKNHFFPESESIELRIPAIARRTNTVSFPMSSSLNGNIEITITGLIVHDMLHIVTWKREFSSCCEVSVLPVGTGDVPFLQNPRFNGMDGIQDFPSKSFSENMLDIREYQPGDRLQHIHWKLSAKRDNLLVKEFESSAELSLCLLFELSQNHSLSQSLSLIYTIGVQHLTGNRVIWLNWWSTQKDSIQSKCLQTMDDLDQALFMIYMEDTYLTPDLAYQNFQPESIGFSSFYYMKMNASIGDNSNFNEGGIMIAFEEK